MPTSYNFQHSPPTPFSALNTILEEAKKNVFTQAPRGLIPRIVLLYAITILGVSALGWYSAYSYWASSYAFANLLSWQFGIRSSIFVKLLGPFFALSGISSNAMQSTVILLEELLNLFKKRSKEEYYLLKQETWWEFFKKKRAMVVVFILSAFAAIPIGFMTREDDGLVNAILIGLLTLLISCRGVENFGEHLPHFPGQSKEDLLLKKTQSLIAARLEQSMTELQQRPPDEIERILNELKEVTEGDAILNSLLNLCHTTSDNQSEYLVVDKPSWIRRLFIFFAMITVPFQIGYALLAYAAGKAVHTVMAVIALATAILDYGGLAWDATEELARKVGDGKKTLSDVLAPKFYKILKCIIYILGLGSGATLGWLNYSTLHFITPHSALYNQTHPDSVLHAPKLVAILAQVIGFFSDSFSNMFYAVSCTHLMILLWMAYCSPNPFNRSLSRLHVFQQTIASIFRDMDLERYKEWKKELTQNNSPLCGALHTLCIKNSASQDQDQARLFTAHLKKESKPSDDEYDEYNEEDSLLGGCRTHYDTLNGY